MTEFHVAIPDNVPAVVGVALQRAWDILEGDCSQGEFDIAVLTIRSIYEMNTALVQARAANTSALSAQRAYSRLADQSELVSQALYTSTETIAAQARMIQNEYQPTYYEEKEDGGDDPGGTCEA